MENTSSSAACAPSIAAPATASPRPVMIPVTTDNTTIPVQIAPITTPLSTTAYFPHRRNMLFLHIFPKYVKNL
jgi:hypothetical protein